MTSLPYPARMELARTPTPVHPLVRTSEALGVDLWVKRDDLTGAPLSGNKIRKLEFLMTDALTEAADVVITCGGAQSNHARATAVAAARCGIECHLLLRGTPPADGVPLTGNLLLDRIAGATITWVTPQEYANREALLARLVQRYAADDRRAYAIPEGGSDAMGAWGYARMVEELNDADEHFDCLIHAVGSGGTSAGLAAGRRLIGLDTRMVGIPVCDDAAFFRRRVDAIGAAMAERFQLPSLGDPPLSQELELLDGFVGRGYGLTRPEELADLIIHVSRWAAVIYSQYHLHFPSA